jgi:hypothetical protein
VAPGVEHDRRWPVLRPLRVRKPARIEVRAGEVSKGVTVRSAVLEDLAGHPRRPESSAERRCSSMI